MPEDTAPTEGLPWWVSLTTGGPMPKHNHESQHLCDRCNRDLASRNEMLSERVDVWTTASNLLANRQFPDNEQPTPADVLDLAIFLAEENNG